MEKVFKNDLISVIIPVYNVEKYLRRCLDSIINQTYDHIEIILIDDGSTDSSGLICETYQKLDSRIKVFHKENGGLSSARNLGIKKSAGKYITFVDSDDWIFNKMIEDLYNLLIKYNADFSSCKLVSVSSETCKVEYQKYNNKVNVYTQEEYVMKFFKIGSNETIHYACGKLYNRNIIENNQYPVGLTSEDVLGTYKAILKSKKIVEINYPYYYYFRNGNSITGQGFNKKDLDLITIWDMVIKCTQEKNNKYYKWAKFNRNRIDYTLLMRMAIQLKYRQIVQNYKNDMNSMLQNLKHNKRELLKAGLPISRKITIIFICLNYRVFVFCCQLVRRSYV